MLVKQDTIGRARSLLAGVFLSLLALTTSKASEEWLVTELPRNVQGVILSYLPFADLQMARLVCKCWAELGFQRLNAEHTWCVKSIAEIEVLETKPIQHLCLEYIPQDELTNWRVESESPFAQHLRELRLSLCDLTPIPSLNLGALTQLTTLTAGVCPASIESVILPAIQANTKLTSIKLFNVGLVNPQKSVLADLFQGLGDVANLTQLSFERFEGVAPYVCNLIAQSPSISKLKHLKLRLCLMAPDEVDAIVQSFGGLPHLSSLNLAHMMNLNPHMFSVICAGLPKLSQLERLNLSFNPIDEKGAGLLAGAVRRLPHLKHLQLRLCRLTSDTLCMLVEGLQHVTQLTALDLRHNQFTGVCPPAVKNCFEKLTALKKLRIDASFRPVEPQLQQLLGCLVSLEHLTVQSLDLGEKCIQALEPALVKMPNLKRLSLEGVHSTESLEATGGALFAAMLIKLKNLQTLEVMAAYSQPLVFSSSWIKAVTLGFAEMPAITSLGCMNFLFPEEEAVRHLNEALPKIKRLFRLSLFSSKGISGTTLAALCKTFESLPYLNFLDLRCILQKDQEETIRSQLASKVRHLLL